MSRASTTTVIFGSEAFSEVTLSPEALEVLDAVCEELGVSSREHARRARIGKSIAVAYERGPRQPLDLVQAGLGA